MSKSIKSPLRYPGGKQKIVSKLFPLTPKNIIEYREPFLGGGSVFLHFKQQENEIKHWWINDGYQPVANFWQQVANCSDDTIKMIRALMKDHPDGKDLHKTLRRLYNEFHDEEDTAAAFFILNRCSFSGLTFSGGYSQQAFEGRLTESSIKKLSDCSQLLKNVDVTNYDYSELLTKPSKNGEKGVFIFMDPPYDISSSNLYGESGNMHGNFNHAKFAEDCKACWEHRWMITYNDNEYIRTLFNWANIQEIDVTYSLNSTGIQKKELVISNY